MIDKVRELVRNSRRILVFTGAGISTGSGIPDFRGPQGLWTKRQPVLYQEFLASEDKRVEHWTYKLEGWDGFLQAQPNAAHFALAELENRGKLRLLVTQNIDGLHHKAGSRRVVELHGTNRLVECLSCGERSEPHWAFEYFREHRRCPTCPRCGGFVKTATVSFGQAMPRDLLEEAFEAASDCDLVLSLGSTLSVQPAASVPLRAAQLAPYVIVNRGPTDHDDLANYRLDDDLVSLLPRLVD